MKVLKVSLLVKIVGGHSADEALWHFFSETACKWRGKEGGGTKFDSTMPRLYISGGRTKFDSTVPRLYISGGGKEGGGTKFDSTMPILYISGGGEGGIEGE